MPTKTKRSSRANGGKQKHATTDPSANQMARPIGFVNFDGTTGHNSVIEVRVPFEDIRRVQRGQYVLVGARSSGEAYLGRVTQGPFYTPDAVGKESAFARAAILMANDVPFLPDFHGICLVEILGLVQLDGYSLGGFFSRPFPKSQVWTMDPERIGGLLKLDGNMYIGHLTGYDQIKVHFNGQDKRVLPRNLGIFGTVGSGKTNTAQVIIEEAMASGWSVIVLDVEGEYISMDKPSGEAKKSRRISSAMQRFGVSPAGVDALQVYRCPGTESRRPDAMEFCISFGNLSPYTLSEIMGLNEAQELRFLELFDDVVREISGKVRRKPQGRRSKWDRFEGDPIVGIDPFPELTLELLVDRLRTRIETTKGADRASWRKVQQLLGQLQRYRIFDTTKKPLTAKAIIEPGLLTVFDLSDSTNVRVNNIIIAEILRLIFAEKLRNEDAPPTLILIEEAHTFVSRENVRAMEATMDMLREITRRGRKRWLALGFISQQPAHLPNEIYELCNTKIVHQTTGHRNLEALRISAGSVNDAVWGEVPVLGQGRALIICPQYSHPVLCDVRPCRTHREYTD